MYPRRPGRSSGLRGRAGSGTVRIDTEEVSVYAQSATAYGPPVFSGYAGIVPSGQATAPTVPATPVDYWFWGTAAAAGLGLVLGLSMSRRRRSR